MLSRLAAALFTAAFARSGMGFVRFDGWLTRQGRRHRRRHGPRFRPEGRQRSQRHRAAALGDRCQGRHAKRWTPPGFGGKRRSPEEIRRKGWCQQKLVVVCETDPRLTWPERALVRQSRNKLYGYAKMALHGRLDP